MCARLFQPHKCTMQDRNNFNAIVSLIVDRCIKIMHFSINFVYWRAEQTISLGDGHLF